MWNSIDQFMITIMSFLSKEWLHLLLIFTCYKFRKPYGLAMLLSYVILGWNTVLIALIGVCAILTDE